MSQRLAKPKVRLVCYSLRKGNGGIARMARLAARVVAMEQDAGHLDCMALSLADSSTADLSGLPVRLCGAANSRARFLWNVHAAAVRSTHFVCDTCNMAQALPRFPGLRRPAMTFLAGIEVWENARPRWINACRRSNMLVSISDHTRKKADFLHGGFSRARVCWLATEDDDPVPPNPERYRSAPPNALIVSRVDARENYKGHRELIDAWPRVLNDAPQAVLHVVGDGTGLADLRRRAADSPAADSIRFHGYASNSELETLYRDAWLFAMPSRGEGFGLVYVEAMRHGLPTIGAVHDAAREVILDGETGYTVDLEDPSALGDRLALLLSRPDVAETMGEAGRRRWSEQFCFRAFRRRFLPILNDLIGLG